MRRRIVHLLLITWTVLLGCGYKTAPRPATATIPDRPGAVEANAYPDRIVLKWDVPLSNADGSALDDLSGFKVFRTGHKVGEPCNDCEHERTFYANVDYQTPVGAEITAGKVVFPDDDVKEGGVYIYSVAAYNLRGREGPASPSLKVSIDAPPGSPVGLRVTFESRGAVLQWDPPVPASGIQSYRIYRGAAQDQRAMKPLGRTKWTETDYVDSTAEKDQTYFYVVRSLKMTGDVPLESMPSEALKVVLPKTDWKPPDNVRVAPAAEGISVFWDRVVITAADTEYNVYRSQEGMRFEKINVEPVKTPWFIDKKVRRGRNYRYAVTAYPAGDPDEESVKSASETIKYAP
ncbi:MAG: hypothetical protein V2B18_20240, partial [Pseudomonadota bacterium]